MLRDVCEAILDLALAFPGASRLLKTTHTDASR